MFSAADAARYLDEAHRTRARYQNLPEAIAPKTVPEAYAAQEALCALWEPRLGPIAGRKIATTTKVMQQLMGIDHPCMGAIFASRIHKSPATIVKADYVNVRVEASWRCGWAAIWANGRRLTRAKMRARPYRRSWRRSS